MTYPIATRLHAAARYQRVGSTKAVADEMGVSRTAVATWARSFGVPVRSHGGDRRSRAARSRTSA